MEQRRTVADKLLDQRRHHVLEHVKGPDWKGPVGNDLEDEADHFHKIFILKLIHCDFTKTDRGEATKGNQILELRAIGSAKQ